MPSNYGVTLDPSVFFVPSGVIDIRPEIDNDGMDDGHEGPDGVPSWDWLDSPDGSNRSDWLTDSDYPSDSIDSPDILQTPQWLSVISQEVRVSSDGTVNVDIVVEVEDITGCSNYEIRVTK